MKRLYLVRHAKSSWENAELSDQDRPLNARGKRDAPFMGGRLKKYKVRPDLIISSPAKRARKTAKIIASEIDYPTRKIRIEKRIYSEDEAGVLALIQTLDRSCDQVMIFGHNPTFTNLAAQLSNHAVDNIPTCGIFCIEFAVDDWQDVKIGQGQFLFFDYPKKHQD